MAAGSVVKCVYEFSGEVETDLSLVVGDLVKITKVVNEEWYEGICDGKKGSFPKVFVEDSNNVFDVAIAVAKFEAEQDDDLPLEPGDYVVISEIIDESWLRGIKHGGKEGTFPKNFIKYISFDEPINTQIPETSIPSDTEILQTTTTLPTPPAELVEEEIWLVACEKFSSQAEGELNLFKGGKIKFLKFVDSFWCEGETPEGIVGIFPATFVKLTPELQTELDELNNDVVLEENIQNNKENAQNQQVNTDLIVENYDTANVNGNSATFQKAIALYKYVGTEADDLSFEEGQEIIVVEKIDDNWLRGQIGDNVGMFAACYVELQEHVSDLENISSEDPVDISADNKVTDETNFENNNKHVNHDNSTNNDVTSLETMKPAKKKPPGRPKPPVTKKDFEEDLLNNFVFDTQSQPYVIIPFKYRKPGDATTIRLQKSY